MYEGSKVATIGATSLERGDPDEPGPRPQAGRADEPGGAGHPPAAGDRQDPAVIALVGVGRPFGQARDRS